MIPLLCAVLAGHLLGDWIVQTDEQARSKGSSWWAMARHIATYHATIIVAALALGAAGRDIAVVVAVSAPTHALLDRRWPVVAILRYTGSAPFSELPWAVLVADQALHLSILLLTVGGLA